MKVVKDHRFAQFYTQCIVKRKSVILQAVLYNTSLNYPYTIRILSLYIMTLSRSRTMRFRYWTVHNCRTKCEKPVGSVCCEIRQKNTHRLAKLSILDLTTRGRPYRNDVIPDRHRSAAHAIPNHSISPTLILI